MDDSALVAALHSLAPTADISLVLPFTTSILLRPEPLLPLIYQTVLVVPTRSCHVRFSSPNGSAEQLYDSLRRSPQENWSLLQRFLSQVYATLSAAQWECGKIDLEVEVGFASAHENGNGTAGVEDARAVIVLEGYQDLLPAGITASATHTLPCPSLASSSALSIPLSSPGPAVVALGGTFDHLHAAHKLLLHLAHFLSERKLIVGVMSDSLLSSKSNRHLVQPLSERIAAVEEFLSRLNAAREAPIDLDVLEIHDAFGPTRDDPDIQALVISDETRSGGEAVNKLRRENGLEELEVWCIDVISGSTAGSARGVSDNYSVILKGLDEKTLKEVKMGSTGIRRWLAEKQAKEKGETGT